MLSKPVNRYRTRTNSKQKLYVRKPNTSSTGNSIKTLSDSFAFESCAARPFISSERKGVCTKPVTWLEKEDKSMFLTINKEMWNSGAEYSGYHCKRIHQPSILYIYKWNMLHGIIVHDASWIIGFMIVLHVIQYFQETEEW